MYVDVGFDVEDVVVWVECGIECCCDVDFGFFEFVG